MPTDPIVILGAGLSGLSIAHHLGGSYRLYEKESEVGGTCRTRFVDGFGFDYAEHFLRLPDSMPEVGALVGDLLGDGLARHELSAAVHLAGVEVGYPLQTHLHGLPPSIISECLLGAIRAAASPPPAAPRSFEEWILAYLGEGIARHFMLPYNHKIWAVPAHEMTCDWFQGRAEVSAELETILEGAVTPGESRAGPVRERWYPRGGGCRTIAQAFARNLDHLQLDSRAVALELGDRRLHFADGTSARYERLVSTIPLTALVTMLTDCPDDVAAPARGLRHNSAACVNVGVDRGDLSRHHWIYFPEPEFPFARVNFPANFSAGLAPPGQGSVQCLVTYLPESPPDLDGLADRCLEGLRTAGLLREEDRILVLDQFTIEHAFPIPTLGHRERVDAVDGFLRAHGVWSVGRYGSWTYTGMEHAIALGAEVARELGVGVERVPAASI
jgi:UDP-galactopyranose mutase